MKKLLLFFMLTCLCFGENYHEWVDFGGVPSATVGGCVSVITGDLSINQDDLIIRGHEPIRIKRKFYSQFPFYDENQGWECGFTHLVATLSKRNDNDKSRFLKVPEPTGIHVSYKISWDKIKHGVKSGKKAHFKLNNEEKGSISSLGELRTRENPLNNVVHFKPYDVKEIIVEGSNGIIRHYRSKESIHRLYQDNNGEEDEK